MKIFLLIIVFTTVLSNSIIAQVAINTDGSNPSNDAILDITSNSKGLLIPRMTNAEIRLIPSPAGGLLVYSTDDKNTYCFHSADNVWKELSLGTNVITPYAIYSIGTGNSCSSTAIHGPYNEGITLITPNIVTIYANITVTGVWSIATDTINGYSFSGSDTVTTIGAHQLTLAGSGTPGVAQTDNFTAIANNGSGTCTFDVVIDAAPIYPSGSVHCISGGADVQNVYNSTTGEIWMDRDLGASDVFGYGDLYQWGRFSDGHQCRNSGTTTNNSNSNNPGHDNFIVEPDSPFDWRSPQNENLWQGENGINNPCPSNYRLPTSEEWDAERLSWTSNTRWGAYMSPLHLNVAGYRKNSDGTINNVGSSGHYWSSTSTGTSSYEILFYANNAFVSASERASGKSVRCIRENVATYSIGSGNSCTNNTLVGPYQVGIKLISYNTITLDVNFTKTGQWSISSDVINGYSFSGSGAVTSPGIQRIKLTGNGTPISEQVDIFTLTASNGGGNCTFSVSVCPHSSISYRSSTLHYR